MEHWDDKTIKKGEYLCALTQKKTLAFNGKGKKHGAEECIVFFYKGPADRYFKFCRLYGLCLHASALLS